jgi:hypothetical protein
MLEEAKTIADIALTVLVETAEDYETDLRQTYLEACGRFALAALWHGITIDELTNAVRSGVLDYLDAQHATKN